MSERTQHESGTLESLVEGLSRGELPPRDEGEPRGRSATPRIALIVAANLLAAAAGAAAMWAFERNVRPDGFLKELRFATMFGLLAAPITCVANILWTAAFDAGPTWRRWLLAVPVALLAAGAFYLAVQGSHAPRHWVFAAPLVPLVPIVPFWGLAWLLPHRLTTEREAARRLVGTAELMLLTGLIALVTAWVRALGGFEATAQDAAVLYGVALFVVVPVCGMAGVLVATALALLGPPESRRPWWFLWPLGIGAVAAYVILAMVTDGFTHTNRLYGETSAFIAATIGLAAGYAVCAAAHFFALRAAGFRFARLEREDLLADATASERQDAGSSSEHSGA